MSNWKLGAIQVHDTMSNLQSNGDMYHLGFDTDRQGSFWSKNSQQGWKKVAHQLIEKPDGTTSYIDNDFGNVSFGGEGLRGLISSDDTSVRIGEKDGDFYTTLSKFKSHGVFTTDGGQGSSLASRYFDVNTESGSEGLSLHTDNGADEKFDLTINGSGLVVDDDAHSKFVSVTTAGVFFKKDKTLGFSVVDETMVSQQTLLAKTEPDGSDPLQYATIGQARIGLVKATATDTDPQPLKSKLHAGDSITISEIQAGDGRVDLLIEAESGGIQRGVGFSNPYAIELAWFEVYEPTHGSAGELKLTVLEDVEVQTSDDSFSLTAGTSMIITVVRSHFPTTLVDIDSSVAYIFLQQDGTLLFSNDWVEDLPSIAVLMVELDSLGETRIEKWVQVLPDIHGYDMSQATRDYLNTHGAWMEQHLYLSQYGTGFTNSAGVLVNDDVKHNIPEHTTEVKITAIHTEAPVVDAPLRFRAESPAVYPADAWFDPLTGNFKLQSTYGEDFNFMNNTERSPVYVLITRPDVRGNGENSLALLATNISVPSVSATSTYAESLARAEGMKEAFSYFIDMVYSSLLFDWKIQGFVLPNKIGTIPNYTYENNYYDVSAYDIKELEFGNWYLQFVDNDLLVKSTGLWESDSIDLLSQSQDFKHTSIGLRSIGSDFVGKLEIAAGDASIGIGVVVSGCVTNTLANGSYTKVDNTRYDGPSDGTTSWYLIDTGWYWCLTDNLTNAWDVAIAWGAGAQSEPVDPDPNTTWYTSDRESSVVIRTTWGSAGSVATEAITTDGKIYSEDVIKSSRGLQLSTRFLAYENEFGYAVLSGYENDALLLKGNRDGNIFAQIDEDGLLVGTSNPAANTYYGLLSPSVLKLSNGFPVSPSTMIITPTSVQFQPTGDTSGIQAVGGDLELIGTHGQADEAIINKKYVDDAVAGGGNPSVGLVNELNTSDENGGWLETDVGILTNTDTQTVSIGTDLNLDISSGGIVNLNIDNNDGGVDDFRVTKGSAGQTVILKTDIDGKLTLPIVDQLTNIPTAKEVITKEYLDANMPTLDIGGVTLARYTEDIRELIANGATTICNNSWISPSASIETDVDLTVPYDGDLSFTGKSLTQSVVGCTWEIGSISNSARSTFFNEGIALTYTDNNGSFTLKSTLTSDLAYVTTIMSLTQGANGFAEDSALKVITVDKVHLIYEYASSGITFNTINGGTVTKAQWKTAPSSSSGGVTVANYQFGFSASGTYLGTTPKSIPYSVSNTLSTTDMFIDMTDAVMLENSTVTKFAYQLRLNGGESTLPQNLTWDLFLDNTVKASGVIATGTSRTGVVSFTEFSAVAGSNLHFQLNSTSTGLTIDVLQLTLRVTE